MPKKGENSKAVEARSRKEESKRAANEKQRIQAEDREWAAAGEGAKSKAQAKKQEQAKQREEAAAKKAEARQLAEKEAASLASTSKAATVKRVSAPTKVTSHQLQLQREADKQEQQAASLQAEKAAKREVSEGSYEAMVGAPNVNRQIDEPSARTVEDAISLLSTEDGAAAEIDRHPERRAKAAFESFSERELPRLKLDRPGLRQSQYKDALWKQWQKSSENPFNRVAA